MRVSRERTICCWKRCWITMKYYVGARSLDWTEQKHGIPKLRAKIQKDRDKSTQSHQGLFESTERKSIVNGAILMIKTKRKCLCTWLLSRVQMVPPGRDLRAGWVIGEAFDQPQVTSHFLDATPNRANPVQSISSRPAHRMYSDVATLRLRTHLHLETGISTPLPSDLLLILEKIPSAVENNGVQRRRACGLWTFLRSTKLVSRQDPNRVVIGGK